MMDPIAITAQMSDATFAEMIQLSPRKVRETMYAQFGIKGKKSLLQRLQEQRDDRVLKLHERLKKATSKQEAEVCKELVRNWLFSKRPMLKAALDYLGVPNENGLVDVEPDFFQKLSKEKVRDLVEHLSKQFDKEHVQIYLRFVETPHV